MTIWKESFWQGIFLCLIQGIQQIAVAQHEQSIAQQATDAACKLYQKAQLAFALFTQGNRVAQAQAAEQGADGDDDANEPADDAQKAIITGVAEQRKSGAEQRQESIHGDQENVRDQAGDVQLAVDDALGLFCADGQENADDQCQE